ncbi:unnamed protein product [Heligmosomoides polygyrus]|uniref:Ion_trans domain-containing protein n=1 Tax=Heligmosomoides polygyrus TaxID=6339 RepID=A0A183G1S1_HELPZ|nr:unnamed protein product [Heligmosomoides polygyrus]
MPAAIFMMEYKTKEELMLQPHTLAEHLEENSESDSSLSDGNSYSDSSLSESEELMKDKLRFSFRREHNVANGSAIIAAPVVQPIRSRRRSSKKHSSLYVSTSHAHPYDEEDETPKRHDDVVIRDREGIRMTLVMIVMIDRKQKMWRKVVLYFGNYRNGVLLFATVTYVIAFCIRCNPSSRMAGRVLLVCNSVLWSLKLLDYMRVFRQLGPYITMAAEMIPRMLPILAMLFVSLLSFGLVRESITYPYENWHWLLIRNIFYKPYFMLYGEVYAPEIDTCGDEIWDSHLEEGFNPHMIRILGEGCVPGYFVAPMFMTVFMLIANVLLMNTMVACCTYVFEHNVENTQEIWLFERYSQVMEYDSTPFIPPPLTIFFHLYWLFRWARVRNFSRKNLLDASLSRFHLWELFLSEEQIERIHSFEEECIEDMEREKDIRKQSSNDERIHRTAERSDQILNRTQNRLHDEYTSIADTIRMDRNLQMFFSQRHVGCEREAAFCCRMSFIQAIVEQPAKELPEMRTVILKMTNLRLHASGVFSNVYRVGAIQAARVETAFVAEGESAAAPAEPGQKTPLNDVKTPQISTTQLKCKKHATLQNRTPDLPPMEHRNIHCPTARLLRQPLLAYKT